MPTKVESTVKSKAGAPAFYKTPEDLQEKIDEIVEAYPKKNMHLNVYLLAVELGFKSPSSLWDYCNRSDEFSTIIERTKNRIIGEKLALGETGELNATMVIWQGKINHGMIEEKVVVIKDETGLLDRMKIAKGRLNES